MMVRATRSAPVHSDVSMDFGTYLLAASPPGIDIEKLIHSSDNWAHRRRNSDSYIHHVAVAKTSVQNDVSHASLKSIIIKNEFVASMTHLKCASVAKRTKKSVTFADNKGLVLATVRVMTEPSDQPPNLRPEVLSSLCKDDAADVTGRPPLELRFKQPASDYMAFRNKVDQNCVCLENVIIKDYDIIGTIKVKNIAFEKKVFVRCTFDGWFTSEDIPGNYVATSKGSSMSRKNVYDTFTFKISVSPKMECTQKVEFCVCYDVSGNQYWDNKDGKNYQIVTTKDTAPLETVDCFADLRNVQSWPEFACWNHVDTDLPYY